MRMLPALFIALNIAAQPVLAEDNEILKIRQEYNDIYNNLCKLKAEEFEPDIQSSEGVEAKSFRNANGEIRLIKTTAYAEMGKQTTEYYYNANKIIFILNTEQHYNAPFALDEKTAKETGTEPYNPEKTTTVENRYYFKQDQLIRWIQGTQTMPTNTSSFKQHATSTLTQANQLFFKQTLKKH